MLRPDAPQTTKIHGFFYFYIMNNNSAHEYVSDLIHFLRSVNRMCRHIYNLNAMFTCLFWFSAQMKPVRVPCTTNRLNGPACTRTTVRLRMLTLVAVTIKSRANTTRFCTHFSETHIFHFSYSPRSIFIFSARTWQHFSFISLSFFATLMSLLCWW